MKVELLKQFIGNGLSLTVNVFAFRFWLHTEILWLFRYVLYIFCSIWQIIFLINVSKINRNFENLKAFFRFLDTYEYFIFLSSLNMPYSKKNRCDVYIYSQILICKLLKMHKCILLYNMKNPTYIFSSVKKTTTKNLTIAYFINRKKL